MVPQHAGCEEKGNELIQLLSPAPALHASTKVAPNTKTGAAGRCGVNFTASSPALCSDSGDSHPGPLSPSCFPRRFSGSSPASDETKALQHRSWGCSLAGCCGQGEAAPGAVCPPALALPGSH